MTGLLMVMTICLAAICLATMALTGFLVWWTMDSAGQHSISAGKQQRLAVESMRETVSHSAQTAQAQMHLTELLLLGRPTPQIVPELVNASVPETPLMPDDLWKGLPTNIQEAMVREAEEAGIWPNPSETLHPDSGADPGTL